jgi:hypothetical protein
MPDTKFTTNDGAKITLYKQALPVPSGGEYPVTLTLQQRSVVTAQCSGTVILRYTPRNPKASGPVRTVASEPVDTTS